ncbi:disease resistance protein RGA2-like [Curcuma longa]|uniref:disease resistance protein RGA2-like n=1 Tax=Curcuma longa TaxID=136217 RepID=UPI003D9DDAA1
MDIISPILKKAVASNVINKLIDKATNYMRDHCCWKTDLQEELQSLRRLLHQIEEVLVFAEDRLTSHGSSNPELIKWLPQFGDVIDEVEEELDELEYLELEKESDSDIDPSFRPAKRFLRSDDVCERLRACVKNLKTSASDVEKFLVRQTCGIGTGQMHQENLLLTDQSRITSPLPVLSFKGREEEKGKIIQYLLGESVEDSENVHCLPLVAMSGMGKTTLAKQVFDHFENVKKEHFDIKIWVCDSSIDLHVFSLMKKILEDSTGRSESGPLELIPVKLKKELHSKRFLLVLDDVWDDKHLTQWEKLYAPLRYGQKGSWIILTTRLRSVARMASSVIRGTMEPMTLQDLSKDECPSLLYEPAFAGQDLNEFSPPLKIGNETVEKIDGVPLQAESESVEK